MRVMPLPVPRITEVIRHLETMTRIDRRRRMNLLCSRRAAVLHDRLGLADATETARQRLIGYASAHQLSDLAQLRYAIWGRIFTLLRNQWEKPTGLTGYEWKGD